MNREAYVAIAVRLAAIYIAIRLVLEIPKLAMSLPNLGEWPLLTLLVSVVVVFAAVMACFCLWFFPLAISRKLLPVMEEPRSE